MKPLTIPTSNFSILTLRVSAEFEEYPPAMSRSSSSWRAVRWSMLTFPPR